MRLGKPAGGEFARGDDSETTENRALTEAEQAMVEVGRMIYIIGGKKYHLGDYYRIEFSKGSPRRLLIFKKQGSLDKVECANILLTIESHGKRKFTTYPAKFADDEKINIVVVEF